MCMSWKFSRLWKMPQAGSPAGFTVVGAASVTFVMVGAGCCWTGSTGTADWRRSASFVAAAASLDRMTFGRAAMSISCTLPARCFLTMGVAVVSCNVELQFELAVAVVIVIAPRWDTRCPKESGRRVATITGILA